VTDKEQTISTTFRVDINLLDLKRILLTSAQETVVAHLERQRRRPEADAFLSRRPRRHRARLPETPDLADPPTA